MSQATTEVRSAERAAFDMFRVTVRAVAPLGANFFRFTFAGEALAHFADNGRDQRIKLLFPAADGGFDHLPTGVDWYRRWCALPDDHRPALRTYTVRAVRPNRGEVDVDIALHGRIGVASAWACDAAVGDELVICGPDARYPGVHGGVDFLPPAHTGRYLLVGDETALPAIASILEGLPADAVGTALLEVESPRDALALGAAPAGFRVHVLDRAGEARGSRLIPAVHAVTAALRAAPHPVPEVEDVDIDVDMLWEVPRDDLGGPARSTTDLYAWLAGEAGTIKALRRHLVTDCGVDRRSVAFMGYWRQGRAEAN